MFLRQVSKYVYDVFFGTGWPQADAVLGASDARWARVRRNTWGLQVMAGVRLNKEDLNSLTQAIADVEEV
jgi:hypothetical protein